MKLADFARVVRGSVVAWVENGSSSTGATIAFYTLFSIAPILLFVMWIASAFIAANAVQERVFAQMQLLLGTSGAEAVHSLLVSTRYLGRNGLSTAVGILTLLIGATSVFAELQNALARIWHTKSRTSGGGIWPAIRDRLLSFGLVLGVGFLLLVSLMFSAALEGFGGWLGDVFGHGQDVVFVLDMILGFVAATGLFALIFKYLPRETIYWRDVWVGALVTAGLFTVGKILIIVYLGRASVTSAYGAAGSFLVLMLWVYYSAQIFLLGAEFTHCYAYQHGSHRGDPA
jgi:membrane protein